MIAGSAGRWGGIFAAWGKDGGPWHNVQGQRGRAGEMPNAHEQTNSGCNAAYYLALHGLALCSVQSAGAIHASGAGTSVQLKDCELEANIAKTWVCPAEPG